MIRRNSIFPCDEVYVIYSTENNWTNQMFGHGIYKYIHVNIRLINAQNCRKVLKFYYNYQFPGVTETSGCNEMKHFF